MMRPPARPRLLLSVLLVSLSCACSSDTRTFPAFNGVDRLDIACNSVKTASVTDPAQIQGIVSFINQRQDNWTTPWAGVPIGSARVEIHRGKEFLGSFGSGHGFFETQQDGGFYSRDASAEDLGEFKKLLEAAGKRVSLARCWSS